MLLIFQIAFLAMGVYMLFTGKIEVGGIRREGENVRKAGMILISPIVIGFLVGYFLVGLLARGNVDLGLLLLIGLFDIGTTVIAFLLARQLITVAPEIGRQEAEMSSQQEQMKQNRQNISQARILSVSEAARYLQKSEAEVMALIDGGVMAAARINGNFQIARSVLDEYLTNLKQQDQ